jgi:hypothetical protein
MRIQIPKKVVVMTNCLLRILRTPFTEVRVILYRIRLRMIHDERDILWFDHAVTTAISLCGGSPHVSPMKVLKRPK